MDSDQNHLSDPVLEANPEQNSYYAFQPHTGSYAFENPPILESSSFNFTPASFLPRSNHELYLERDPSGYTQSSSSSHSTWEERTGNIFEPPGERPPIPPFPPANFNLQPSFFCESPRETSLGSSTDLNGLSTSPILRTPGSASSGVPTIVCTECLDMPKFRRQPDKDRHDREKHGCLHPDCGGRGFSTAEERQEHMDRLHGGMYPGMFNCGSCQARGHLLKTRKDKLKKHFKTKHRMPERFCFDQFQCKDPTCYDERIQGGLYCTSLEELKAHMKSHHSRVQPIADPNSPLMNFNHGRVHLLVHNLNSGNILKHGLEPPVVESQAKRSRSHRSNSVRSMGMPDVSAEDSGIVIDDLSRNDTPVQDHIAEDHTYDGFGEVPDVSWQSTTIEISMFVISDLNRQDMFHDIINWLRKRQISAEFHPRIDTMKLGGRCSPENLKKGKEMVEKIIHDTASEDPWHHYQQETAGTISNKGLLRSRAPEASKIRIAIVHPDRDRYAIETWTKFVMPKFPDMMKHYRRVLGRTYSAVLVRHVHEDGTSAPIIRFCSAKGQADVTREAIRDQIAYICRHNGRDPLPVHFEEGTRHRLVGGRGSDSRSNDQKRFPHGRRPWLRMGMGVSIGMKNCRHVSASSGGYLSIGGIKYMLSVDHVQFPRPDCTCETRTTKVSAPSLGDIEDLRELVRMKVEELKLKIKYSAPVTPIEIDGSDTLDEHLFRGSDKDELELYQSFAWELNKPNDEFELGDVKRSGNSTRVSSSSRHGTDMIIEHQMDWCLIQVKSSRVGKNRHRHRRCLDLTLNDLSLEDSTPLGAGKPCERIVDFRGGEAVYYVGPTSGLREGHINAVPEITGTTDGTYTHEWVMAVEGGAHDKADFEGDSGTWILDADGNAIGMLWSWNNGFLNFTPLEDIVADIRERVPQWRNKAITIPPDESGIQRLSRKHGPTTKEGSSRQQTPVRMLDHTVEPAKARPDLSIIKDAGQTIQQREKSDRSMSPTPSLVSSECSTPESLIAPSLDLSASSELAGNTNLPLGPMAMTIKAITWPMDIDVRLKKSGALNESDFTAASLRQPIETC